MDNTSGIKLFNDDSTEIAMPSVDIPKDESFVADQLGDALEGEQVQKVLLPFSNVLEASNYVLDFTDISTITVFQKEALKGLLYKKHKKTLKELDSEDSSEDNVELITIYMYRKAKDTVELGKGEKFHLEKAIPLLKKYVFSDEIKVYKNYNPGSQEAIVITEKNISFRLNL